MSVQAHGLREVEKQLIALGDKRGTRVLRRGMLSAAKPILQQAQQNISTRRRGSGALHQSLGMRFSAGKPGSRGLFSFGEPPLGGTFTVEIGPRRSDRTAIALYNLFYRRRISRIFYGHFIEFGFTARSGRRVSPAPFLKPALDSKSSQAVTLLGSELRKGIARLLRERK